MNTPKSILHLFLLCFLCCPYFKISAKRETKPQSKILQQRKPTTEPIQQKLVVVLSSGIYAQLLDYVRKLSSETVIDKNGNFTEDFLNLIQSSTKQYNLSTELMRALLQAGFNLHASFTGNNQKIRMQLLHNQQVIETIITSQQPTIVETVHAQTTAQPIIQKPTPQAIPQSTKQISNPLAPQPKQNQKDLADKQSQQSDEQPIKNIKPRSKQPLLVPTGITTLQDFRKQTAQKTLNNFYNNEQINEEWLQEALRLVLNGAQLTSINKEQMKGELVGNATELIKELLQKESALSSGQRQAISKNVEDQTIAFIDKQPLIDKPNLPKAKQQQINQSPIISKQNKPSDSKISPQKSHADQAAEHPLPRWIDPIKKSLIVGEFESALIRYVAKNPYASKKQIIDYFIQQIKNYVVHYEVIENAIRIIVKETFKKPEDDPTSQEKPWPNWLSSENGSIITNALIDEIISFFAKNTDLDDNAIFHNIKKQLPKGIANKKIIEAQLKATISASLS